MSTVSLISTSSAPVARLQSSSSSFTAGNKLQLRVSSAAGPQRLVVRAVCKNESPVERISKEVKKLGVAAAAALLLSSSAAVSISPAQALDVPFKSPAEQMMKSTENPPVSGTAEQILNKAKQVGNDNFAETQRTGAETVGETASAGKKSATPAINQVDPNQEEASEPFADQVAARADFAADSAPGTTQQEGKGTNPIEKAFATPTRGIGDKLGEQVAQISNRDKFKNEIPGQGTSGENPGIFDGLFNTLREAGKNRDEGKSPTLEKDSLAQGKPSFPTLEKGGKVVQGN